MNRWTVVFATVLILVLATLGCSGDIESPVAPTNDVGPVAESAHDGLQMQAHLWGYYDVFIDFERQTVEAVVDRQAMFTANVVNFINSPVANLSFKINGTAVGPDYVDVDIDVGVTHPFPGLPPYHGYDVRGVFMGDGSAALGTGGLVYPVLGTDQFMLSDPGDGYGGPDGYTRWFNITEFSTGGMPMFSYTQGKLASPGFDGTATLNPYKYFADGLGVNQDLWTWLDDNGSQHGRFSSGATNERNYYLRFPDDKGVVFGYAIIADWEGVDQHPSNAPEAVACSTVVTDNVYYVDPGNCGGNLILDLSLFGWEYQPPTIFVESTVLSSPHEFTSAEMIPTGGGEHYSTYHVEIPADNVKGTEGNEFWVIAQYDEFDYKNAFGTSNLADGPLSAYFRHDLVVAGTPLNSPPQCDVQVLTSMPFEGWDSDCIEFDASGTFDPDPGDTVDSYEWDFNNDGEFGDAYDAGTPDKPKVTYSENYADVVCVRVTDNHGASSECCTEELDITVHPSKNIDVTNSGGQARDLCIDHNTGDVLIVYDMPEVGGRYRGEARRYYYADYYSSSTYTTIPDAVKHHWLDCDYGVFIDSAPNGYWLICSQYGTSCPPHEVGYDHFSSTDIFLLHWGIGIGDNPPHGSVKLVDAVCLFAFGNANDHAGIYGRIDGQYYPPYDDRYQTQVRGRQDPSFSSGWSVANWWYPAQSTGYDALDYHNIAGAEADPSGNYVWFVEDTDHYAARFSLGSGSFGLIFATRYFGTGGSGTDDDDGVYDPLDMTCGESNHFFVLDELSSGDYAIKGFVSDGSSGDGTTPLASFSQGVDWAYDAVRIDGSPQQNLLGVLMTDGSNSAISIFLENETPDS